jgi:hypothetical protein
MQRIVCLLFLAPVLSAQAGPGMLDADPATTGQQNMVQSTYFSSVDNTATTLWDVTPKIWTTAGRSITQVSTGKTGMAGLAAGEYHMCMTTSMLAATWTTAAGGSTGGGDVIIGKVTWNSGSPVFTPTTLAAKLCSSGGDFGLMIDGKDGTRAAVDWPGSPQWSVRTSNAVQFPIPVALTGTGASGVDPAPGHINGVLGCFWIEKATKIFWAPVNETFVAGNLTAASLDTAKQIVVILSVDRPHSPTPLFNSAGNASSMWFSRVTGGDSDQYYSGQIPDTTGGQLVYDSASWSNNGGVAGSHMLAAYSGHYNTLLEGRGSHAGCNSAITVGASASLDFNIHAPVGSPTLFTTTLGVALGVGAKIPLPGICGALGLDATKILLITGGPTGSTADETVFMSLPASDSGLKGITLHLQFLTNPITAFGPCFTNTMSPTFK